MSSGHRERGFFDPRTPWADAYDVGVVGMMFMHMRSMLLYVICLLHVYFCCVSLTLDLDICL